MTHELRGLVGGIPRGRNTTIHAKAKPPVQTTVLHQQNFVIDTEERPSVDAIAQERPEQAAVAKQKPQRSFSPVVFVKKYLNILK